MAICHCDVLQSYAARERRTLSVVGRRAANARCIGTGVVVGQVAALFESCADLAYFAVIQVHAHRSVKPIEKRFKGDSLADSVLQSTMDDRDSLAQQMPVSVPRPCQQPPDWVSGVQELAIAPSVLGGVSGFIFGVGDDERVEELLVVDHATAGGNDMRQDF
jgi:hypothetical protein